VIVPKYNVDMKEDLMLALANRFVAVFSFPPCLEFPLSAGSGAIVLH
jgi:hypothetical protein